MSEKMYVVATVDLEGVPISGPFPIMATNATNAVEAAFEINYMQALPNTKVVVQLPNSGIALVFEAGQILF